MNRRGVRALDRQKRIGSPAGADDECSTEETSPLNEESSLRRATGNSVCGSDINIHETMHGSVLENEFSATAAQFAETQRILKQDQLTAIHIDPRMVAGIQTHFQIAGQVRARRDDHRAVPVNLRSV